MGTKRRSDWGGTSVTVGRSQGGDAQGAAAGSEARVGNSLDNGKPKGYAGDVGENFTTGKRRI